ncbi:MAG: ribbon-helix-helix protein, CopG family [Candidatus Omnitrophota bacterium]
MRNVVAISLPDIILKKLKAEAKEEHTSRSEVIRKALKQHFFLRDFSAVRGKAMRELEERGVSLTEEQLFDEIS